MSLKKPESVLIVIYNTAGYVLLMQRADWPGFWQSVTGGVHEGETLEQTAWRELREETGLGPEDGELTDCQHAQWFDIYPRYLARYPAGTTQNLEHVFCFKVAKQIPVTLNAREHTDYQWLPRQQAIVRALSDTNKEAIARWVPSQETIL